MFDGLAAAGGRLFVSTVDGRVLCLAGNATPFLPSAGGPPDLGALGDLGANLRRDLSAIFEED